MVHNKHFVKLRIQPLHWTDQVKQLMETTIEKGKQLEINKSERPTDKLSVTTQASSEQRVVMQFFLSFSTSTAFAAHKNRTVQRTDFDC